MNWGLVAAATTLLVFSCTPEEPGPELAISDPEPAVTEKSHADKLADLDRVVGSDESLKAITSDIRSIIEAKDFESKKDLPSALSAWKQALANARDGFGSHAFEGWIRAMATSYEQQPFSSLDLAKKAMAESNSKFFSEYLQSSNLNTEQAMMKAIEKIAPDGMTSSLDSLGGNSKYSAPSGLTFEEASKNDRRLTKLATKKCKAKGRQLQGWNVWSQQIKDDRVSSYWHALTAFCSEEPLEAIKKLALIFPVLAKDSDLLHFAVEAGEKLAILQRRNDQRHQAADSYMLLQRVWQSSELTPAKLGTSDEEFLRRKINDALWAARYRSTIGDFDNGKRYAKRALTYISTASPGKSSFSRKFRRDLIEFRAEGYHILAFRIAVEKKDYANAMALSDLAAETTGLDKTWKDRLLWFSGLYSYLSGDYTRSNEKWEHLLSTTTEDSSRAKLYFWLAKSYQLVGKQAESSFYMQSLVDDYPLNYYSVVAAQKSKFEDVPLWSDQFRNVKKLRQKLANEKNYNLEKIRKYDDTARKLKRSEILIAAQLQEYAKFATKNLSRHMDKKFIVRSHAGPFVYLSRLLFASGQFAMSIGQTTKVANEIDGFWKTWPEQILIYFPQPYRDIYDENTAKLDIDRDIPFAISRQESGFTADIDSYAGAKGIMQIIIPTALTYARKLGMDTASIRSSLTDPQKNIAIGTAYLKDLKTRYNGFFPAVSGGYNAGEFVMDIWMKRRSHEDPLAFVELVPFGETKGYIRNVWRNSMVYRYLFSELKTLSEAPPILRTLSSHSETGLQLKPN